MSTAHQANASPLGNWRLNSLRFTFFADTPLKADGSALFEEFFGLTPDAETHRKAEFLSQFTAEKGSVVYQTIIAGPKVDFLISMDISPEALQAGFPTLPLEGNFEARFSEAATSLATKGEARVNRVAVGAHHVELVANKDEGYHLLGKYIPGIRLDASCSDFQYRINRPRSISCAGQEVRFNRLSTWACMSLRVGIAVAGGVSSHARIGSAVSVNTDINTVPAEDFSKFTDAVKASVIENLFLLSREIAEKGDVP